MAGINTLTMPKWGLSMQSGTITEWLVAEGNEIQVGDDVADIDTDKIAGTLESDASGTVRRLVARVGEPVPVGGAIALLAGPEVSDADVDRAAEQARAVIDAGIPDDADNGPVVTTVNVGERAVKYVTAGEDGPVVLLIHGYGGDRDGWLFVQEALSNGARVAALDLPGHGGSDKDVGDGSLDLLVQAVVAVLDDLGADRAHLVGHSLGGGVAVLAAAAHPGRIASLTLLAPVGFGTEINAGYLRGFADAQTRRELKPVVAQLFADEQLLTRQMVDDLLAYKRIDGVAAALAALHGAVLDGDGQRWELAGRLPEGIPTTVIWGSQDRVIPVPQAVPGAEVVVVDGAGHMPQLENPSAVVEAIRKALGGTATEGG